MPPPVILDPREIDTSRVQFDQDEIRRRNPHRHEFQLLHAILTFDPEKEIIVGVNRIPKEPFWARGHIPGRPIFPGVLMVETAAQLCSFYWRGLYPDSPKFFGFGGIDSTRFRGEVKPGQELVVVGSAVDLKPRRAIFDTQGFVGEKMVFDSRIMGVLM